jgi:plasmid stabilization system protein ParE
MRVVWSPLAVARVREAAQYIARDNPGAARRWAEGVFERVGQIADFPTSGRIVPELGREDVRELIHGNYRIIYRTEEKAVLVLTVRHGKRLFDPSEVVPK